MAKQTYEDVGLFHGLVQQGSIEDLRAALSKGAPVNAPGHVGATALMVAIEVRDLEKFKLLIEHGADPEQSDDFNQTALRVAVLYDYEPAVEYLLSLGVDRGYQPKFPLKPINYELDRMPATPLPAELQGIMSEAEWDDLTEQGRESMRESGRHPTTTPMIADVQSVTVLQHFLRAGDRLELAPREVQRTLIGLTNDAAFQSSVDDYRAQKSPRFGASNPERMDLAFWHDMVRTGASAYGARAHFQDTNSFDGSGAVWSDARFGVSLTTLPDGRFVQIGGEHEDFYDPDFHIYNDVIIHDGHGGVLIYGYPAEVFPPTDFHTATLVGDYIYIVGCLGYVPQRVEGQTAVYRLHLDGWQMEAVPPSGDNPGWLHGHSARYEPERNVLVVTSGQVHYLDEQGQAALRANQKTYELDLATLMWRER